MVLFILLSVLDRQIFWTDRRVIQHKYMKPTQFFFFNLRFSYSELFKAKTLEFFSKTLPILKADDTLPKVARYEDNHISQNPTLFHSKPGSRITFYHHRTSKRSVAEESEEIVPKEEVSKYRVSDMEMVDFKDIVFGVRHFPLHFYAGNRCTF